jgi:hypothetical protein
MEPRRASSIVGATALGVIAALLLLFIGVALGSQISTARSKGSVFGFVAYIALALVLPIWVVFRSGRKDSGVRALIWGELLSLGFSLLFLPYAVAMLGW